MTEIFPDDDPFLDQNTAIGVRSDPVTTCGERPASAFPEAMALSGKGTEPFLHVEFDMILSPEE